MSTTRAQVCVNAVTTISKKEKGGKNKCFCFICTIYTYGHAHTGHHQDGWIGTAVVPEPSLLSVLLRAYAMWFCCMGLKHQALWFTFFSQDKGTDPLSPSPSPPRNQNKIVIRKKNQHNNRKKRKINALPTNLSAPICRDVVSYPGDRRKPQKGLKQRAAHLQPLQCWRKTLMTLLPTSTVQLWKKGD